MPFVATVVNRVHGVSRPQPARGRKHDKGGAVQVEPALARALLAAHDDLRLLARAEDRVIERLEDETGEPLLRVPELEGDVHDLRGLARVAEMMFGGEPAASAPRRKAR